MITPKQRKILEGIASVDKTKYQIGKNGLSSTAFDMFDKALTARELIKIDVMKSSEDDINKIAFDLASELHAEVVKIIGRAIILYRRNKEKPIIKL